MVPKYNAAYLLILVEGTVSLATLSTPQCPLGFGRYAVKGVVTGRQLTIGAQPFPRMLVQAGRARKLFFAS
jgi:hypothetical protein